MHKLRQIFAFVAPYVKPYWGRIVAGVFFGILFGGMFRYPHNFLFIP